MIPEPVILSFYDFIRENVVKYSKNKTGRYGEMKNLEKVIPIFWFAVIAVSGCGKETVVQKVETNTNILWQSDTADVDGDGMADQVVVEGLLDNGAYDTLLTVTLDSGATGSMRFKGRTEAKQDFITVATGDIFSDGKDAVVIEITNSSSNYGSSDIHVLSMEQVNGKLYITERLSILDGMENSTVYSLYKESFFPLGEPIVSMTSEEELITPLPEQEINAIKVNGYGEEAGSGTYVYWNGDEWVASDNVFFYEEDIPLEESFELGNYYVTNRVTSDGKLYGMGASLSGLLGEENGSDIYDSIEAYEKISTPTLLMENVAYARAGREAIVALGMDANQKICNQKFYFSFRYKSEDYKIPCSDILYFESKGRKINVYIQNASTETFNGKLFEVETWLADGKIPFIRIHQSYLVNYHHIRSCSKTEITLIDGTKLPISEDRKKSFRKQYNKLLEENVT